MRRLAGKLLTLCAAAAAVLCVAVGVFWARSHLCADSCHAARAGCPLWVLCSEAGWVQVVVVSPWPYDEFAARPRDAADDLWFWADDPGHEWQRAGIHWQD